MDRCGGCERNGQQPFSSAGARCLHRARHATLRGSAVRARIRQLYRRCLVAGAELCRVRARAACPCPHRLDRHVSRAQAAGRAGRAYRRGLCGGWPHRHGAFSQSGGCERRQHPNLAAEAVVVEYQVLPAVTDVMEALADGAPTIWPDAPDNLALDCAFGDCAAVEAAIKDAHVVVEQTIRNQRTASAFMEPRAAIGSYDAAQKKHTLISGCQGAHRLRHALAACFKVQQERVHVICPDVGGAFGSRFNIYPEQVVVVWAARRVGRPVKWTADRSEAFLTDY